MLMHRLVSKLIIPLAETDSMSCITRSTCYMPKNAASHLILVVVTSSRPLQNGQVARIRGLRARSPLQLARPQIMMPHFDRYWLWVFSLNAPIYGGFHSLKIALHIGIVNYVFASFGYYIFLCPISKDIRAIHGSLVGRHQPKYRPSPKNFEPVQYFG